jgi:hypothetical protein
MGTLMEQVAAGLRNTRDKIDVLDRELSALEEVSLNAFVEGISAMSHDNFPNG